MHGVCDRAPCYDANFKKNARAYLQVFRVTTANVNTNLPRILVSMKHNYLIA